MPGCVESGSLENDPHGTPWAEINFPLLCRDELDLGKGTGTCFKSDPADRVKHSSRSGKRLGRIHQGNGDPVDMRGSVRMVNGLLTSSFHRERIHKGQVENHGLPWAVVIGGHPDRMSGRKVPRAIAPARKRLRHGIFRSSRGTKADSERGEPRCPVLASFPEPGGSGKRASDLDRIIDPEELEHPVLEEQASVRGALARMAVATSFREALLPQQLDGWSAFRHKDEEMVKLQTW